MIGLLLRKGQTALRGALGEHRIATVLTVSNAVSLLMSLGGTLALSYVFELEDIGRLGIVSSVAMLFAPFITFRLDLAFERLRPNLRIGLIMLVHLWALVVGVAMAAVGGGIAQLSGKFQVSDAVYLGISIFFFCSHSFIWSWLVGQRRLIHSALLQVSRSFLSAVLPLLFYMVMPAVHALLLGAALSQATAVFYLIGSSGWSRQAMVRAGRSVWLQQSHLFLGNSFPVFLNLLSVYGGPPLISFVFGAREAGILWLILRFVFTPATLLTDPIRRSIYAKHPQIAKLSRAELDKYRRFFWGMAAFAGACAMAGIVLRPYLLDLVPLKLHDLYNAVIVAGLWACAVIGNSPLYGLIPTLRMKVMPTVVEITAIVSRVSSICLGLVGLSFNNSVILFFLSMLIISIWWGSFIYRASRRLLVRSEYSVLEIGDRLKI